MNICTGFFIYTPFWNGFSNKPKYYFTTKTHKHEKSTLHYRRYISYRLGIRIILLFGRWHHTHTTGYSHCGIAAWGYKKSINF